MKSKRDRFAVDEEDARNQAIVISEEWEQQLKEFPQFASKYPHQPLSHLMSTV